MTSNRTLAGKIALVTGASSGIGRCTARELAREGASVVVAARREKKLDELTRELKTEFDTDTLAVPTDVSQVAEVDNLVAQAVDRFDRLDIVANIAGVASGGSLDETSVDDYQLMVETNLGGTFFVARAVLPHLKNTEGVLILMSSYAGRYPYPANPVYGMTRWGIRGFAHSITPEAGAAGVGVSVINPAEVRTRIWRDQYEKGEISEPEEVAEAVAFMARQDRSTIHELDLYHRGKFSFFE